MTYSLDDAILSLQQLVRIPSVAEAGHGAHPLGPAASEALAFALDLMERLGFRTVNLDNFCGFGEIGDGERFDILGHLDVVPAGSGWSVPPFSGDIVDGTLYGRGTLDDKGPMIAILHALHRLRAEGLTPTKRIRVILGLDEECGWRCMDHYRKSETFAPTGFSPDGDFPVINAEKGLFQFVLSLPCPDGVFRIQGGERSNMVPANASAEVEDTPELRMIAESTGVRVRAENGHLVLTAAGIAAHASHPEQGDNAILKLFRILGARWNIFEHLADVFGAADGSRAGLSLHDEESGPLTLNLGTVRAEGQTLVMDLDIRSPVTCPKEDIVDAVRALEGFTIERIHHNPPLYLPPTHPLIQTLLGAWRGVTGDTSAQPIAVGGGTFARLLPVGCAFGPALPGESCPIHQADERISLRHFALLSDVYHDALRTLCFR